MAVVLALLELQQQAHLPQGMVVMVFLRQLPVLPLLAEVAVAEAGTEQAEQGELVEQAEEQMQPHMAATTRLLERQTLAVAVVVLLAQLISVVYQVALAVLG